MATAGPKDSHERLKSIQQRLASDGRVRIDELAVAFGVHEMTIRRDLDELEVLGVARRVRGGAMAVGPEPFAARHRHNARAKATIADKLHRFLPVTGTIALDASSTVYRLAAEIDGARDLVVVSNGFDTFQALAGKVGITPVLTGGTREPRTDSFIGPVATRAAADFFFDAFICSAAGLDAGFGSSEASLAESDVKRAFASNASRIVLAVDHTKLGGRGRARMFQLDELDVLVTDLNPTDSRLDPYRNAAVEIV